MAKQKLVVIGNGMAGARAVEEILPRGGGEQFDITMFGDEPYGNYNRILLSNVLNGSQDPADIFLNPLAWYEENNVTLHAGARVTSIDRAAQVVTAENGVRETYDKLLIATGSRAFVPPMEGATGPDGALQHRRLRVPHHRRLPRHHRRGQGGEARRGDRRRAARAGGGARPAQLRLRGPRHPPRQHLMNNQLDPAGGAILQAQMEKMGVHVHLEKSTTAILGDDSGDGPGVQGRDRARLRHGRDLDGDHAERRDGPRAGLTVERAIVTDNQMRSVDDPDIYVVGECAQHRGRVYGLVAPLWEQGQVLADHITGRNRDAAVSRLQDRHQAQGDGRGAGLDGRHRGRGRERRGVTFSEPKRGTYKKLIIRDGHAGRRDDAGRHQQGRLSDAGLRPGHAAAGGAAVAAVRHRRRRRSGSRSTRCPRTRRSATATASPRARSATAWRRGGAARRWSWTRRARAWAAARARTSSRRWSSGIAAARSRKTPPSTTTCPASRCPSRNWSRR